MGFPLRITRDAIGPTLVNKIAINNPTREVGDTAFNMAFWQLAGCNLMVPLARVLCSVAAGALTLDAHVEAWNPNQSLAAPTVTRTGTGVFTVEYLATYLDENSVAQAVNLSACEPHVQGLGSTGAVVYAYATKLSVRKFQINVVQLDDSTEPEDPLGLFASFW